MIQREDQQNPKFAETTHLADYFLFDRLREGRGSHVAVRFGRCAYTYDAVADRSLQLAYALVAKGIQPGERILVVLPDTPPFVWSIFGILRAGAVLAMGNPEAPTEDLLHLVRYTGARLIITLPRVAQALAAGSKSLEVWTVPEVATGEDAERDDVLGSLSTQIRQATEQNLPAIHRDDPAIWLFTSGSTGKSKAAIHTHRDFAYNTEVYAKGTVGYGEDDVTVSVPRLFFGYATGTNLFFPFAVGATACLFVERPTPQTLASAIAMYRPTIVTNVPTMLGKLLELDESEPLDLSSIRFHLSAGEALPGPLLARFLTRFGGAVYDGIGSAEMFHIYVSNRPGDVRVGSLGKVVGGYTVKILADDAEGPGAPEVPVGETGVLWVKGDSVAMAYHQDRDKSFATFHGHWCRTGDLFRQDEAGYLYFQGRADDLLKVGGLWVAPVEVEECLLAHPDVLLAAVIGVTGPAQGDYGDSTFESGLVKPKAYVVIRDGADVLAPSLQDHVKRLLAKHKYPRWIAILKSLDEVPKNDRGKVDRRALVALHVETGGTL